MVINYYDYHDAMHKKIFVEIIYYENATDNYFVIVLIFEIN